MVSTQQKLAVDMSKCAPGLQSCSAPLARQDAHKLVANALVLPKHEAHFATTHANVPSWHISIGACSRETHPLTTSERDRPILLQHR